MRKKQKILLILSTLLVLTILFTMIIPALAYTDEEERSETEVLPVKEELGDKLDDMSVEETGEGEDEVKDREETDEQGIVNEETTREGEDGEEADEEGAAEEGAANEEATDDDGIDEDADDEGKEGIEEEAAANEEMPEVFLEEGVVRLINTLRGSSFCLYTLDAVQITEREYEDNGTVVFRDIAPGEYYLFEEQASVPYGTMYMIFVEKGATETIVDMAIYFNGW